MKLIIAKILPFIMLIAALVTLAVAIIEGQLLIVFLITGIIILSLIVYLIFLKIVHKPSKFRRISEREFLNTVNWNELMQISVLGHTGKRIFTAIYEILEKLIESNIDYLPQLNIILRSYKIEGAERSELIKTTIRNIKHLKSKTPDNNEIDFRFYDSIPSIRGIICESNIGEKKAFISNYRWVSSPKPKTRAFDYAVVEEDSKKDEKPVVNMLESWIEHYWGNDEIHTVAFDFDDTLVSTAHIQIEAWVETIIKLYETGMIKEYELSNEVNENINNKDKIKDIVRKIFLEKQIANEIISLLFQNIAYEKKHFINDYRFKIRKGKMRNVQFFEDVVETLHRLKEKYNICIISSTDEDMIMNYLANSRLHDCFSLILGKKAPGFDENMEITRKCYLLLKLRELNGIPLDRMVFIGDNNTDYCAAKELGITFVEARIAAKALGENTLIKDIDPNNSPHEYYSTYKDKSLDIILERISIAKQKEKWEID